MLQEEELHTYKRRKPLPSPFSPDLIICIPCLSCAPLMLCCQREEKLETAQMAGFHHPLMQTSSVLPFLDHRGVGVGGDGAQQLAGETDSCNNQKHDMQFGRGQ